MIPLTSFDCQPFSYVLMKHWTLLSHIPRIKKTSGVKVPCWTFIIRLLQFRVFSCSCFLRTLSFAKWIYDGEWVSVILISIKAFWSALHTPLAVISGLEAFPDSPLIVSHVTGYDSRYVSTSVTILKNISASKSLKLLCHIVKNLLFLQLQWSRCNFRRKSTLQVNLSEVFDTSNSQHLWTHLHKGQNRTLQKLIHLATKILQRFWHLV